MLLSFMINAILFLDIFSIWGLVTTGLSCFIDLGIVFFLTRPVIKIYFSINSSEKNLNHNNLKSI
jgi:hypothetical protein